jgi:uncharacterized membrane protein YqaE (UPF0057 family)
MRKNLFLVCAIILFFSLSFSSVSATVIMPVSTPGKIVPGDPDPAKVKTAVAEFKGLSKKEKKERAKEAKQEIKKFKAAKREGKEPSTNTLLLVILAILLPPLAVYLHEGVINNKFWIDLLLTLIFWLPGVIYALVIILGDK